MSNLALKFVWLQSVLVTLLTSYRKAQLTLKALAILQSSNLFLTQIRDYQDSNLSQFENQPITVPVSSDLNVHTVSLSKQTN